MRETDSHPFAFGHGLQAFKDYAFDGRAFDGNEIRQQIDAAESSVPMDGCYGILTIRIRKPDLNQNESIKP